MKKIFCVLAVFLCVGAVLAAQIPENLNVVKIEEDGKTENGLPYTITIEYLPATGEAFFTVTINQSMFNQADAMIAIRDRAMKFIEETQENGVRKYYHYVYRGADSTKYDGAKKKVYYTSRIRFLEKQATAY
ncbi:hypothetical protein H0R92_06690 [Treponema sp. OMZ 840]|uniref:hypothetical protein n=1 Tax=Treponema sp. OMZ 840 TaxID=244313 RepID=UPI003D8C5C1E